jgi:hypothetical protein
VHALRRVERGAQRLERDRRRRQVGIPAAEVDEPRARQLARGRRRGDDPREVLLGEAREEVGQAANVRDAGTLLPPPGRSRVRGARCGFPHPRTLASRLGGSPPPRDSSRMPPAASYKTRMAVAEDAPNLRRLAALDSQSPLSGPVLMGEIDGVPAAAIALTSGRVVADPFRPTAELVATMRMRAAALTGERRTSLRERVLGGLRVTRPATPRVA